MRTLSHSPSSCAGHEIVTDKKLIANRYLKGWFFVDLVATISWGGLVGAFDEAAGDRAEIGLLRLIKIARLARASRLIQARPIFQRNRWALFVVGGG